MLVCAFPCATLHTRPRVQRAPGLPCALCALRGSETDAKLGRIAPRERGRLTHYSVFERSMPSDLIRGWIPVRVKKTRQNNNRVPAWSIYSAVDLRTASTQKKSENQLVGVAGFEPATPASRTHQPTPHPSQYQRLNPTHCDCTNAENSHFPGPACRLRAEAGYSIRRSRTTRPERVAQRSKLATAFQSPADRGDRR
jgi:hypothetical protein